MARNHKQGDSTDYLSAPKTSATMNLNGTSYLVESYYTGNKKHPRYYNKDSGKCGVCGNVR